MLQNPESMPLPEIRKAKVPEPPFNPQKEKYTFTEVRRDFVTMDAEASTSGGYDVQRQSCDERMVHNMPSTTNTTKVVEKKVSSVKTFLKIMLGLLQDDEAIAKLSEIIDQCGGEPKTTAIKNPNPFQVIEQPETPQNQPLIEKSIKQVSQKKRTSQ